MTLLFPFQLHLPQSAVSQRLFLRPLVPLSLRLLVQYQRLPVILFRHIRGRRKGLTWSSLRCLVGKVVVSVAIAATVSIAVDMPVEMVVYVLSLLGCNAARGQIQTTRFAGGSTTCAGEGAERIEAMRNKQKGYNRG